MKEQNNHREDMNLYRYPPSLTAGARRRGYRAVNFNYRSPDYRAMKAHLRASAYDKDRKVAQPLLTLAGGGGVRQQSLASILQLRRAYGEQASRNFVRDGILLAVFVALSAWAFIHTIQAMAG